MDATHEIFSDEFKALWEPQAPVRQLWGALETFHEGLCEMAVAKATALFQSTTMQELQEEIEAQRRPMEDIYVDWVNLLWTRIVLRTQLKVRDSLKLLFYSCNTANTYGCALASRAILEHVALLQYLASRVPWRSSRLVKKEDLMQFTTDLHQLAFGSRLDWERFLSGTVSLRQLLNSGVWSRPSNERIPAIGDLIGVLDDTLSALGRLEAKGQIQFVYSVLCDVVHPSWGGDFAYSPRMYRDMNAAGKLDAHFKLLATLFCLPIVEVVRHLVVLCDQLSKDEVRIIA